MSNNKNNKIGPIKKWFITSGDKWYKSWIVKNLIFAAIALFIVIFIFYLLLNVITRHNKELEVPDLTNMSIEKAQAIADKYSLRIEISDSVYIPRISPGQVLKQNPQAKGRVKKNRRILLTINAIKPKMVQMPSLVGYFLRQANSELISNNLRVGKLIYVEDIASDNVLEQLYNGRPIKAGKAIPSESEIDLKLGLGSEDNTTYIPDLKDIPYSAVKGTLVDNSLNLGRAYFDKSIKTYTDSLNAVVYKQVPASSSTPVSLGTSVSVYLKNKEK
jgi:Uncharacterized protein conserved in bacteria